ncbi:polysaccharide biosynthesis protein [uncultured Eubacterium sp.]|uniref:polysaccharide biosynthesis protein n=1 Tax=uncultured Eubacterium sp. TaxID=165185 RepID=UPI0025F183A1|nr:polysaccharide biosynthesis protein [uncultured Eubacterium sp.]
MILHTNTLKNKLISGTLLLTLTGIISRIIGFYYKIFLSRSIGAEGLGIYQLIFPVFALIISISAAGIQTALSRYCAQCETDREARAYLLAGLTGSLSLSGCCILIIQTYAQQIGLILLEDVRTVTLLRLMTWSLPFACIHACINGYYYGKKKAAIPAISQILEQIVRVTGVWILLDILAEQRLTPTPKVAVCGILFGELAGALYSLTALFFSQTRKKTVQKISAPSASVRISKITVNLCSMAVPLTCNRILLSICQSAEAILIPMKLRDFGYTNSDALSVYGILTGMVFSTIMFPCVLSNSLSVMLLPTISEANSRHRQDLVKKAVRKTTQLCIILGLLCTLGFLLCGNWIGIHLFHNALASIYVRTLSWICPFLFLASTLCSILHGLGKATLTMLINLLGAILRIGFIFVGIPRVGLSAYLWGMLASQILISVLALISLRRFHPGAPSPQ